MVKVKPGAKVITIMPAQDAYGNISIVKPGGKVITIELAILLFKPFAVLLFNKSSQ
jgi:hypothetical protein